MQGTQQSRRFALQDPRSRPFNANVRVVGHRSLTPLAKSRTLSTLVWNEIQPHVLTHESRLQELQHAMMGVQAVQYLDRKQIFPPHILNRIASIGGFQSAVATLHQTCFLERCGLEKHVRNLADEIKSNTKIVVTTVGAANGKDTKEKIGINSDTPLALLAADETAKTKEVDYHMLLIKLLEAKWLRTTTDMAHVGDPCHGAGK